MRRSPTRLLPHTPGKGDPGSLPHPESGWYTGVRSGVLGGPQSRGGVCGSQVFGDCRGDPPREGFQRDRSQEPWWSQPRVRRKGELDGTLPFPPLPGTVPSSLLTRQPKGPGPNVTARGGGRSRGPSSKSTDRPRWRRTLTTHRKNIGGRGLVLLSGSRSEVRADLGPRSGVRADLGPRGPTVVPTEK